MTIIDGWLRLPSPTKAATLIEITSKGTIEKNLTTPEAFGREAEVDEIKELKPRDFERICPALCIVHRTLCKGVESTATKKKIAWANEALQKLNSQDIGFYALKDGQIKSVVEYLPSTHIPYPIPTKDTSIAFITCIYPTGPNFDYKSAVLRKLLRHLKELNYKEVQVIAGRRTPYPNGPVPFFIKHGFSEIEKLDKEILNEGVEELILMKKSL
jgi:hypothetical protein